MRSILRKLKFKKTTIEQATERAAVLQGEYTVASVMHDFYTRQVESIDPHTDWWGFAEVKQKQVDTAADVTRYARLVDEAQARITALGGVK